MRGRVILTSFGVVIGTAAVVVLVSLGVGLQRTAMGSLGDIAQLKQIQVTGNMAGQAFMRMEEVAPGQARVVRRFSSQEQESQGLTTKVLVRIADIEGVSAVVPVVRLQTGAEMKVERLRGWGEVVGVAPDALAQLGLEAASGELLVNHGQVIIGANIPGNLHDPQTGMPAEAPELMGKTISLDVIKFGEGGEPASRTYRFRVVGILAESGQSNYQLFVTRGELDKMNEWATGQRVDRAKVGYEQATVQVADTRQVSQVQQEIQALGLQAYSALDAVSEINSFFGILQGILGGIGGIALLVAAFGIVNTLSMAILERTREIGLMKAIGARNRDVMSIFLGEAMFIGLLGGVLGVLIGWGLSNVANLVILGVVQQTSGGSPFGGGQAPAAVVHTPWWLVAFGIAFAVLVGLLSGIYPALRAATLDPLRALRYE